MAVCPICGVEFEDANSVAGHIVGKTDEDHRGIPYQKALAMIDAGSDDPRPPEQSSAQKQSSAGNSSAQKQSSEQSSEQSSVLYSEQTRAQPSTAEQCCGSPALTGAAGEMFRLDSGEIIQLEQGDRICTNCDEVREA